MIIQQTNHTGEGGRRAARAVDAENLAICDDLELRTEDSDVRVSASGSIVQPVVRAVEVRKIAADSGVLVVGTPPIVGESSTGEVDSLLGDIGCTTDGSDAMPRALSMLVTKIQ